MIEKIIKFFFQKDVKNYLKREVREHRFVNYKNANTILIIFESDLAEQNIQVRNIIQQLTADGKKVKAWGFVDKKETDTAILQDFRILHNKNISFFKKPKDAILEELMYIKADLLIDLTSSEIIPLQFLTCYANASCKAGMKKNGVNCYDFMVDFTSDQTQDDENIITIDALSIFNQINFYLKSIKSKD